MPTLEGLRLKRRIPKLLRVDNGPEFTSNALDTWAYEHGVYLEFTHPGKPMDNGHIESFNRKLRDEFLNQNVFFCPWLMPGIALKDGGMITMRIGLTVL